MFLLGEYSSGFCSLVLGDSKIKLSRLCTCATAACQPSREDAGESVQLKV